MGNMREGEIQRPWRVMLAVVLSFHHPVGNPKRKV
jgi:hypothetical protein